ncbi:hypothetical protein KI427_00515 [Rhodococcus ruber]|uniref:NACHT domain-containing protein n=2 Tax=Rhodococcus TaxID=1827 RepID=UPI00201058B7|nr:hypothetical protein [Rhodococcus ruber]UQB72991.1 hypothetical protein KI427_00515 [Rhodococcus ruber]
MAIWKNPESARRRAIGLPDNILFITNATLGPGKGGGIDTVRTQLRKEISDAGMTGAECWHFDKLCRLLDGQKDVRRAFAGFITPGDILENLRIILEGNSVDVGTELIKHAENSILSDQFIQLSESGDPQQTRLRINQVAIDLPVVVPASRSQLQAHDSGTSENPMYSGAAATIIDRGNRVLRPSILEKDLHHPPHMVIVGGPGQGKTTLSQLIVTAYRSAFVDDRSELSNKARVPGLAETNNHLQSIGLPTPSNRRWPLRIDLAKFARDVAGKDSDVNLLRWVANEVSKNSYKTTTAADLFEWLNGWPWLIVLDGFDEVASHIARETVTNSVRVLLKDAAEADADLFVVITTRPQGYSNEFGNSEFDDVSLEELPTKTALEYAKRLIELRHASDPDHQEDIYQRVVRSAEQPLTARLMRTPLQVTIMTLLSEIDRRAPQTRYGLFDAYYDTIYKREANKLGGTAELLSRRREDIDAIHERIAVQLQCQEEITPGAEATMSRTAVREIAICRLEMEGNTRVVAERIAESIINAATERLVLLVPREVANIGFEVRSLQEYMCARAVASGDSTVMIERLRVARFSAHWRNVWLLSVGRIFATRDELRPAVIELVREMPSTAEQVLVSTGQQLAIELLHDGISLNSPKYRTQLLEHALMVFDYNPDSLRYEQNTRIFGEMASEDLKYRQRIVEVLKQRLDYRLAAVATAWGTVHAIRKDKSNALQSSLNQLWSKAQREEIENAILHSWVSHGYPIADSMLLRTTNVGSLGETLQSILPDSGELRQRICEALGDIGLVNVDHQDIILLAADPLARTIRYPRGAYEIDEVAEELAQMAMGLSAEYCGVRAYLANYAGRFLSRRPVAKNMLATFDWVGG